MPVLPTRALCVPPQPNAPLHHQVRQIGLARINALTLPDKHTSDAVCGDATGIHTCRCLAGSVTVMQSSHPRKTSTSWQRRGSGGIRGCGLGAGAQASGAQYKPNCRQHHYVSLQETDDLR